MSLSHFSIVDYGEIRTDTQGVTTTYLRLVAQMSSVSDNKTALQTGLSAYQRFQPHPTESGLYVSEFQAVQKKHTAWWDCTVTYTDSLTANPLAKPLVIGEVQTFTIPGATLVDYQGEAILNTAGEPPEPFDFPERVMQIPVIKNIAAAIPQWLFDFEDCVNADAVALGDVICAPKTLLISSVKLSAIQTESGIDYRVCTIEVLRRKSTWEIVFPSRGFNQIVSKKTLRALTSSGAISYDYTPTLSPILVKGEVPTEAQFLDEHGKWIPNPNPADVVLIKTLLQRPVPFSQFPLS